MTWDDWAIGLSEMAFSYDLKKNDWTNVPIGIRLEKLFHWGKNGTRIFIELEKNLQDDELSSATTFRLVFVPLL